MQGEDMKSQSSELKLASAVRQQEMLLLKYVNSKRSKENSDQYLLKMLM